MKYQTYECTFATAPTNGYKRYFSRDFICLICTWPWPGTQDMTFWRKSSRVALTCYLMSCSKPGIPAGAAFRTLHTTKCAARGWSERGARWRLRDDKWWQRLHLVSPIQAGVHLSTQTYEPAGTCSAICTHNRAHMYLQNCCISFHFNPVCSFSVSSVYLAASPSKPRKQTGAAVPDIPLWRRRTADRRIELTRVQSAVNETGSQYSRLMWLAKLSLMSQSRTADILMCLSLSHHTRVC
jgi:hypothetical protein